MDIDEYALHVLDVVIVALPISERMDLMHSTGRAQYPNSTPTWLMTMMSSVRGRLSRPSINIHGCTQCGVLFRIPTVQTSQDLPRTCDHTLPLRHLQPASHSVELTEED